MANLKSRKALFQTLTNLKSIHSQWAEINLPKSAKDFVNEVYGSKACVYFSWPSPEVRAHGERVLREEGFKIGYDYAPGSKTSEIQVSYFKGWHHDI